MTTITQSEIEQYRSQLQEYPDALKALDVLQECEGDLEYAAETLAIESGELDNDLGAKDPNEPSRLEKSADKLRPHICTQAFKDVLSQGFAVVLGSLITAGVYAGVPLILVLIYISTKNLDKFCQDC
ncbi:MAG: hypothetical protein JGK24_25530 [Microcoleus sp. PH2017_29_MFU_D_A]|uniref:hypothetical protein n=1 Tax=unclassified Microcoleus TaxID=2642155 RepID=UPI001D2C4822|nr:MULTISPECIES: hypothetical protein [unclassified Microcoleus]MCC3442503.1 hypothetical protein [Microcoleus sp. PH2017_03_ELD_O_A]MCC3502234.1 hypothetical protein [Microcoleus sp. PH2017_19_SFW_U_A]TAF88995.1 MAG: hypothetical protein EAZ49_14655 [Oscillatoriales cyanobacterium]MCC3447058.1 hypothetical protein [Microcoleus sp. PH2017_09_SFU_O_A]MCC3471289.1 hypothetical protein [Microcoleus sp. PH2017_13_LAR_U_A]